MLFFAIQLDEERITRDGIINLDAAYECIDRTFAQKDVSLYEIKDGVRYYVRDIDNHDFEYLWMVNLSFKQVDWFMNYIRVWRFFDMDDELNKVIVEEDLLEDE